MIADIFSTIIPLDEVFFVSQVFKDENITASYKVAVMLPSQLLFVITAIVIYIFPKIAKENDTVLVLQKIKRIGVYSFAIIFVIALFGILLNKYLISFIYGNTYSDVDCLFN
jgi:O-antigen/teichoic acid export membrane protein